MALVYDSTAGNVASGTSASASHSLGSASGNNRCVLIWCFSRGNSEADTAITSVTYNGSSTGVTLVGTYTSSTAFNVRVSLYRVMDSDLPSSSGSYTVACSSSAAQETGVTAVSYDGVDQADPIGGEFEVGRSSVVDPINDSVTTDRANSVVVDGCAADGASMTATTTQSGQVERDDRTAGALAQFVSTRPAATTGSWTLGWDFSFGPNRSQHYLAELHEAVAGPTVVGSSQGSANSNTVTVSHTFSAGTNKKLVVFASGEYIGTWSVTNVTYNGVALTQVRDEFSSPAYNGVSAWYLDDADFPGTPGAYNVVVTYDQTMADGVVHVVELDNAAQGAPEASNWSTINSSTTISTSITTVNDNSLILGHVSNGDQPRDFTATTGQTEIEETQSVGSNSAVTGGELIPTAGSTSMGWSTSSSNRQIQVVLAIGEAGTEVGLANAPFFGAVF